MRDTPIGIGDVIRAADALRLRGAALEAAVSMCGFGLASGVDAPTPNVMAPTETPADAGDTTSRVDLPVVAEALPPSVRRLEPVRQGPMRSAPVDPLSAAAAVARGQVPPFAGLFIARDAVELLRLSASVLAPTDRIDVPLVAKQLAEARPLVSLPRVTVPSLGLGAQVLVDVGTSMQPFWEDQQALVERMRSTLRDLADVRYFADDPRLGAGRDRRKRSWTPYDLPRPGVPVIALTDLGCGFPLRPRAPEAWLTLARRLRRRQSRLVAFAPVRMARVVVQLRHVVEIVVWDRSARRRNLSRLVRALDG